MVKRFITVLLLLAAVPFLMAENSITVDMELYNTVMKTRNTSLESYWAYVTAGKGAVSFKSTGNRNVRADLAGDILYPDSSGIPGFILQKAYIKAKFPIFRLTLGKTRLGWGDGFVFNSGDVIFGSTSPYVNLTGSEIRTDTTWLTSINYPLGRFSFIEGLIVAPEITASGMGQIENSGVGFRIYTKAGGIKIEAGYYFDGTEISSYDLNYTNTTEYLTINALHRPYLSLQGNIGPDWYFNSSVAVPASNGTILESIIKDTFNISLGLFHMMEVGYDNSLSFRLESVILPYLNWSENAGEAGSYAILIYPEISLGLGSTVNLSLRSIISPIDLSAQITSGISWNVFEGFNILAYTTLNAGDGDDTFSWNKSTWTYGVDSIDGISMMAGINYIY
jgi:hypothetical protein